MFAFTKITVCFFLQNKYFYNIFFKIIFASIDVSPHSGGQPGARAPCSLPWIWHWVLIEF